MKSLHYLKKIKFTPMGILTLIRVLKLASKWVFTINIGNYLKHEGKIYFVNNGNLINNWSCLEVDRDFKIIYPDGNSAKTVYIPKEGAKKVKSLKTPFKDFKQGFNFYMGYWYDIWCHPTNEFSQYKNRPGALR